MELHNQIVELLKSLPNIHEIKGRRAFVYSAGLDKELKDQIEFEGTTAQFCQVLVETLGKYGTLEDKRHALVAVLEAAKESIGQEGKALCNMLIQQIRIAQPEMFELIVTQLDALTTPLIDIHLQKIREMEEVTGIEADTMPGCSVKVTIEDVKKGKKVTGIAIKKMTI